MPITRRINVETERRKRELRQRLARSRRRIDADTRAIGRSALERLAWRPQVRRHPLATLGAAAGIGIALSLLPSAGRAVRGIVGQIGSGWITRMTSYAMLRVVARAMRAWRRSASESSVQEEDE